MTTKLVQPDLLATIEQIDAELKEILAQMRETNRRMAEANEALRKRLGLPERKPE